ncbi:MAG TPA: bifunctional heptose 7-phosphate kinase/heptose 1-phosphate adenyltransferase [Fibrobacteria bacterium]|nr:bifunctional heptose 7-phosphate kinase/heptose 1-phosphate adenyltransferase [Fibrobacteria bacterium]
MDTPEILSRFDSSRILVLGDVFIDEYLSGDCSRLSPEAPVPVLRVEALRTKRVLGGAANTAANVASLGGGCTLIGLIGQDTHGREFKEITDSRGIDLVPIHDGRPTMKKIRLLGQRQQLLRLDYEETHGISAATEKAILDAFRIRLGEVSLVVLSDYAKGFFTQSLVQAVIRETHAAGKEVLIDPRPQHRDFYVGCDYITPNWKETQGLLGQAECDASEDLVTANGLALRDRLGSNVILTLGPKGMAVFARGSDSRLHLPTQAREVYDVSGAGDTVVATFALAKAAGADLESAVRLANQAAGIVVGKLGTATVTREELLDLDMRDHRLLSRTQLAGVSAGLKARGKTVVTLNGSFDVMHAGHLHILEDARRQGDVLIVGLNSDASIHQYKGPDRPIIPQEYRAKMLLALRTVDYVHIFDETVPMPFLEQVKPHVHVNGSEYGTDCIEAPTVKAHGGRIHIVEKIPGLSTSDILARIRAAK